MGLASLEARARAIGNWVSGRIPEDVVRQQTESLEAWSGARAYELQHPVAGETIYTARVRALQPNRQITLEGFITTQTSHTPQLEIPITASLMRYSQEEVATLDRWLLGRGILDTQMALSSMMAHRNVLALGYDPATVTLEEAYKVLPFPQQRDRTGFSLGSSGSFDHTHRTPDSYALHLNEAGKYWRHDYDGLEPQVLLDYVQGVNRGCSFLDLQPWNFEDWKRTATEDFAAVRLF